MNESRPKTPWLPISLLAGGIAVAALWRSQTASNAPIGTPPRDSVQADTIPAKAILQRSPTADAVIGNFYFLFDVSASTNKSGSHNELRDGVPIFRRGFTAMKQMDELLPARFRVGTIGSLSLHQQALCDVPVEPPSMFLGRDTVPVSKAVSACDKLLWQSPPEPYTDIRGALAHASLSLRGLSPGVRGIVLVSDLEESLAPNQLAANPDLSTICVAIYSQVTEAGAAAPAKLDSLQSYWANYLKQRKALKVYVVSTLGFDENDLVTFFRSCEAK
jgi:hypothetical protein